MTNERKQDVLIAALVVSVAIHVGIMLYARPKVMTHIARGFSRVVHLEAMQASTDASGVDVEPLSVAEYEDVDPEREAPQAEETALTLPSAAPTEVADKLEVKAPDVASKLAEAPVFDRELFAAEPIKLDDRVTSRIPAVPIETPRVEAAGLDKASAAATGAPSARSLPAPAAPQIALPDALASVAPDDERSDAVTPLEEAKEEAKEEFVPVDEVLSKVDERVVEQEKAAVRDLVNAPDAEELAPFVNTVANAYTQGEWTYFKLMVMPCGSLKPVSKDLVVIIDASGSIGKDRMASIRSGAKKILRSAANTGDRFNLVAFRDRFSYAYPRWQDCTVATFDAADRWLDNVAAFGRTDVFSTISSVLTLPRDPARPLIALVVTDGDANAGVSDTREILSKFTALNDGLISVYMYGVKSSANRELLDLLTRGNRGESYIFDGNRWEAGEGIESLSERFRDPVLSDLRIVFASGCAAETYPRVMRNLYKGETLEICGRVPAGTKDISFSLKGLNGRDPYEGFFTLPLVSRAEAANLVGEWTAEKATDVKLRKE